MVLIKWINYKNKKSRINIYFSNRDFIKLPPSQLMEQLDLAWFNFFIKESPYGFLLKKEIYGPYFSRKTLNLIHVTPSLDKILASKQLFFSGGGLCAAIYCAPLTKNNKLHNLSKVYLNKRFAQKKEDAFDILCIKLFLNESQMKKIQNWGVDYTLFGKLNCQTWKKIKGQKYKRDSYFKELEEQICKKICKIKPSINLLVNYDLTSMSFNEFQVHYDIIFKNFPSLRFILYEVFNEYILLYQENLKSKTLARKGELYNESYRELIKDLCPIMLKKFRMNSFFIPLDKLISYLNDSPIFTNFNSIHFKEFVKWRIAFYIKKITRHEISASDFDNQFKNHPYLLGQILYRSFEDKHLFEKERSKIFLKKLIKEEIICPIYSILPKGEIGINPLLERLGVKYEIYKASLVGGDKIRLGEKLDITISNKFIGESKYSFR